MISIEQVSKLYGDTRAVSNMTLEVRAGEVCVLIGPSGCGKTTTLRMINRLVEPTSGRILISGSDNRGMQLETLRRSIGYAIQSVGLFPHMTVEQNIGTVPSILGWDKAAIATRSRELLELVGLDPEACAPKYPQQLSGGEAQRIGVARALAADPPVLLMDEPFGAVDPLTREMLQTQFLDIQKRLRKTIVLVTHDLDEAIRMADRIAVMRAGTLVQYDSPEELLANPADQFVHDFVGGDRALKRLSRIAVATLIRPAAHIRDSERESAHSRGDLPRYVWVVDDDDRLLGWLDRREDASGRRARVVPITDVAQMSVRANDSLRVALSRMLGQGMRSIPVVDDSSRLLGEVNLHDVEEATAG